MEIGIHTFGELVPDPHTHQKISAHERLKQVIRMAILADEVGLDIFGVGEHHRLDIAASAPSVSHQPQRRLLSWLRLPRLPNASVFQHFSYAEYKMEARKENALFVGSPQQIIDKLLYQHELFGHQRFIGQVDIGGMPFDKVAQVIELLGTEVAPVVRREMAKADQA